MANRKKVQDDGADMAADGVEIDPASAEAGAVDGDHPAAPGADESGLDDAGRGDDLAVDESDDPPGGFTHVVIARNGLFLRAGPGIEFPVLRSLSFGAEVSLLKREGRWGLIDQTGDKAADGFVHLSYLSERAAGPAGPAATHHDDAFVPITKPLLQAIMDRCAGRHVSSKLDLDLVADALTRSMLLAKANNHRREVGFLSQSVIETDYFQTFREYGGSKAKYAPYFGRGMHQLTHRETYAACSQALFSDDRLVKRPDLVADDIDVNISATAWFWRDYKPFNRLADARDVDGIIYRLYGGKITSSNPKVRKSVILRRSYYKTIDGLLDQHSV